MIRPAFDGLSQQMYMLFREPNDLANLDISNGQCRNWSIPQNVTCDFQGGEGRPFPMRKPKGCKSAGGVVIPQNWVSVVIGSSLAVAGAIFFPA